MVGMRNNRARARARDLLATVYPDDADFRPPREPAIDDIDDAERLETANRGRAVESDELISATLDTIARDYFSRALFRAMSHRRR